MYQVLLADDEPSVIASLQKSIDWNGLGLELAGCAGSGREALALFGQKRITGYPYARYERAGTLRRTAPQK